MANMADNFMAMSNAKKVVFVLILAFSVVAIAGLYKWANQPSYQLLYANLSQSDAAQIVEELQKRNIPYRFEGSGAIFAAQEKIYETRLELAGLGLPHGGGVGFELFDKTGLGMSEFVQNINYLRAVQGELARTIGWLSEVETARVHIVVPEKRLFQDEEEQARASVVLKVRQGGRLSNGQVQGIVHLVTSSVAGLTPNSVTVVDSSGKLLTEKYGSDETLAITSSQIEYKNSLEQNIAQRVEEILEAVVGRGKVVAQVSAELDFRRVEMTEENFDPDGAVVRSEQKSKDKSTGGTALGGIPGVASNTPGGQQGGAQGTPSQTQSQKEVLNYEINKVVKRVVEPSGVVKRISVAVLVDGKYEAGKGRGGKEELKYLPRSEEEIKKFESIVKSTIGFLEERGDHVEVLNIPFEQEESIEVGGLESDGGIVITDYIPSLIRYGSITFISILLFLFVLRPLINGILTAGAQGGGGEAELMEAVRALEAGGPENALPSNVDIRQKVRELAKQNPQQAAHIIKGWMKDK
ncbi:MAG: flagellar M-ring protein FliF [Deltaproteobacteria bacterium]|nr:flagellar M-ring protein FliF [Deltaproteobacteria bacterium]